MKEDQNDIAIDPISAAWSILGTIMDPEIPVLSIIDLGIVRDVRMNRDFIEVLITPTYSGCPAMDVITEDITEQLTRHGYPIHRVLHVLQPAWTTDWMSDAGKQRLREYGIAAPVHSSKSCQDGLFSEERVTCPQCGSTETTLISAFGSTSCKALYRCSNCAEPFDYFKCH